MRILLQRVSQAAVTVDGEEIGSISHGYLLLVGISQMDTTPVLKSMAHKIMNMRLFPDKEGRSHFDRSILDEQGEVLAVSQFTLYADTRKGRRPSFSAAAEPQKAAALFEEFVDCLGEFPIKVATGRFGAMMAVSLVNDGPVSIWLDSESVLPSSDNIQK